MLLITTNNTIHNANTQSCQLIGSTYENSIQLLLGIMAFLSLFIKWRCEKTECRRDLQTFLLDGSKQGISSLFAHGANILIATGLSHIVVNTDQCAWYFVSYFLDTFLGVGLAYFLLKLLTKIANKKEWSRLTESGNYGTDPNIQEILKTWGIQLVSWIGIIFISRLFTGVVLLIFRNGFANIATTIADLFGDNPKMLLLFVMIICPGIMNLFQVWIQDNFLKKQILLERHPYDDGLLNNDGLDGIGDSEL